MACQPLRSNRLDPIQGRNRQTWMKHAFPGYSDDQIDVEPDVADAISFFFEDLSDVIIAVQLDAVVDEEPFKCNVQFRRPCCESSWGFFLRSGLLNWPPLVDIQRQLL